MSKNEALKQQREQAHFDVFRSLVPELAGADFVRKAPPAPDFLVNSGPRVIGLELTTITTPRREMESLRDRAVSDAEEKYRLDGGPDVIASFHWAESGIARKGWSTKDLASKLAALVVRHLPAYGERRELESVELEEAGLENVLHSVHIARFPGVPSHWMSPDAGHMNSEQSIARRLVISKEAHLKDYRVYCSEAWLLLVAEGLSISRIVDCEELAAEDIRSAFDRVYLLDYFRRHVYLLWAHDASA